MPEIISLSIRSLCEFLLRSGSIDSRFTGLDRGQEGARIHRQLQKQGGKAYAAEVPLSLDIELADGEKHPYLFRIAGRADGVITLPEGITVDEIKTTAAGLDLLEEPRPDFSGGANGELRAALLHSSHPEHWAQAACYGHILCEQNGWNELTLRLTYFHVETGEIRRFLYPCNAGELRAFVHGLLRQYLRWARLERELGEERTGTLQALRFPFETYREGQRQLAIAVWQTCKNGGRLFACAPTGIGKTVSTLFPALKAVGEGHGRRVFYLTAKTVTRAAAEGALRLLRHGATGSDAPPAQRQAFSLRSVTLTAKDKVCFLDERACLPETCEWANGYYNRINDALFEIMQTETVFTRQRIEELARQYKLCPYELSLDLSLWCDVIICDYNYLFDPVVHLQRFFEGNGSDDNIFLIDEAHNLLDRGREMYSASLSKASFYNFKKLLPKSHKRLHKALAALNKGFITLRKRCESLEASKAARGYTDREPTTVFPMPPQELAQPLERFTAAAEVYLEENRGSELEQELLALYFEVLFYARIVDLYAGGQDEPALPTAESSGDGKPTGRYTAMVTRSSSDLWVRLFCMDPAEFLDESMAKGRAAVLFSATLQPLPYYKETLGGGPGANLLALPSPFAQHHLGLFVAGSVSTKYADRAESLAEVAGLLAEMAASKPGNYIAYFPSYSYMRQVLAEFEDRFPGIPFLVQQPGMDEEAREQFLAAFAPGQTGTLLGFCVMGGIFSEGVDLTGDRLIGTAIVGVGLPQLGPESNTIRRYWDDRGGDGFAYAYQYPGMNKVLQAAGRVIRGQAERGVVLLIDNRFPTHRYQTLFPAHWSHWKAVNSTSLARELAAYWQMNREAETPQEEERE